MSRAADPLIGAVIAGRYEVVRIIGKGGMGTIYEVKNTRLGRSFALKTLSDGAADAELLARFRREAEIVARLTHPNILDVVDWDTLDDGSPCMIMEYLRGEDLATRLRASGPLAWPVFARIADQVLAALTVAHRAGIVHRDLKPQNIFLAADDNGDERVKLLDFGISKLRDARTFTTTDAKVMGTPAYMPPEQAEGRQDDIGPATDVWAMATILYEMATAKVAFEAPNIPAVLYRVVHGRPRPLEELRPDAPAGLVQLIERAFVVDVKQRLDSADRMRLELRNALSGVDGVSWPEPLRARSHPRAGLAPPSTGTPAPMKTIDSAAVAMGPTIASGEVATVATGIGVAAASDTQLAPAAVAPPVAANKKIPWLVPVVLAGATGVAAFIVVRSLHHDTPAPTPTPASSPVATVPAPSSETPAPVAPAQPVAPTPAPAQVHIQIDSAPRGADVYRMPSEAKVGVTPWAADVDRTEGSAVFVLKKKGYGDGKVEIDLRTGGEPVVELAKLVTSHGGPARPGGGSGSASAPPSGRKKGDPVDPFGGRKKGDPVDPFATKQ